MLNNHPDKYPMVADDLYDYAFSLRNAEKLLAEDKTIRNQDRKLIQKFGKHIKAKGLSLGRQAKYLNMLRRCDQLIRVSFVRAKQTDMEDLMAKLSDYEYVLRHKNGAVTKRGKYSAETMSDFRVLVKMFQKFVRYGKTDKKTPYPEEVAWIESRVKVNEEKEVEYFTDEDAEAMIRAATTVRDKAFLATWAEIGGRPAEVLLLRIGDVQFDDRGVLVHITEGKTGPRTLRAISCVAYLKLYVETHPFQKDPNAPLWLSAGLNHLNQPLSWDSMNRLVKTAAELAGIEKRRVHGYMFLHGSATRNAKYFTDAEMRRMYGWSMSSRVPERYIHLSSADIDPKYQAVYGSGRPTEPPKPGFAPPVCPRCGERGSPGMRFCGKCATPLDAAERAKIAADEQQFRDEKDRFKEAYNLILEYPGLLAELNKHAKQQQEKRGQIAGPGHMSCKHDAVTG